MPAIGIHLIMKTKALLCVLYISVISKRDRRGFIV